MSFHNSSMNQSVEEILDHNINNNDFTYKDEMEY